MTKSPLDALVEYHQSRNTICKITDDLREIKKIDDRYMGSHDAAACSEVRLSLDLGAKGFGPIGNDGKHKVYYREGNGLRHTQVVLVTEEIENCLYSLKIMHLNTDEPVSGFVKDTGLILDNAEVYHFSEVKSCSEHIGMEVLSGRYKLLHSNRVRHDLYDRLAIEINALLRTRLSKTAGCSLARDMYAVRFAHILGYSNPDIIVEIIVPTERVEEELSLLRQLEAKLSSISKEVNHQELDASIVEVEKPKGFFQTVKSWFK